MKTKYPPAIERSNGEIKVLYEKCDNIEKLLEDVKDRFETHDGWGRKNQENNQLRFGELEERTATNKQFIFGSVLLALSSFVAVIMGRIGF